MNKFKAGCRGLVLITLCTIFVIGCHKNNFVDNVNQQDDESLVAILLSAGGLSLTSTKAGVDEWNNSEIHVFGLKRKQGVAVGTGAYDFNDHSNFVDYKTTAASGSSTSLEVYSNKEKKIPYFYAEGFVYDFYGYHLGGAIVTDKTMLGDTYSYDVTIFGNNDLMYATTDREKDIDISGNVSAKVEDLYSAWSARRSIQPTLAFEHALSRLNFIVKGKGDKYQNVRVTGVDVKGIDKGTLTVTGTDIGFVADSDAPEVIFSLMTAEDEALEPIDVDKNPHDVPLGGKGACIMIAPGVDEIEVTVHLAHKLQGNIPLESYVFKAKASDILKKDEHGNVIPVISYEAGFAYDFFINIYGPEEVSITAELTKWDDGGDYTYDPDEEFRPSEVTDSNINLSEKGNANCYIVSDKGTYRFLPTKGSSDESVGEINSVDVLWESFGTDITPKSGDLINTVLYSDGNITFQTADTFKEGNAVIAAKDADGNILWSWHIWLTDQPQEQGYYNNAGTMMDRNLGATSATPGDVGALGLLYQWGRKDPFVGVGTIGGNDPARMTINGHAIGHGSAYGSDELINYSINNPSTFIYLGEGWFNWLGNADNKSLWLFKSNKSIYDPCPNGYMVPSREFWENSGMILSNYDYDEIHDGISYITSFGTSWYPAVKWRLTNGEFDYSTKVTYWSSTPSSESFSYKACSLQFYDNPTYNDTRVILFYENRGSARAVRCIKE